MAAPFLLPERVVKNWSSKGKEEGLVLFQKAYQENGFRVPGTILKGNEFQDLLYDLMKQAVVGGLEVDEVVSFLNELVNVLEIRPVFPSLLVDILAIVDTDVSISESKDQQALFKSLTTSCMTLVSEPLLKERLGMDTLESIGLIPSKSAFNQKYVKTKTKIFYKQHKFNLFREENEGYSKLISELGHEKRPAIAAPVMLDNIKSLIGRFNLDPNRVLDVILEAFEGHLDEKDYFVSLLESYPCETSTFVNILGFKFHNYQSEDPSKAAPTPSSLYKLCALLLHEGLVRLTDLYPHLAPSDLILKELHDSVTTDAQTKAKKAQVVSLVEKSDEEKSKEAEAEREKAEYKGHLLCLDVNQKLGLCHALLELGDWDGAHDVLKLLPFHFPVWCPAIVKVLCSLINNSIEPLYRSNSPRAAKGVPRPSSPPPSSLLIKPCSSLMDLYPCVFEMLYCLGPYMHSDPILLAKVIRLGRTFMKDKNSRNAEEHSDREKVFGGFISTLDEVILPSIALLPSNCGMAEELWAMIKFLPYERRYQLYGHWKNDSYDAHPVLIEAKTETLSRGKYIMKRLTKDNVKPSGRQIGKLSHSNPGVIFDYVLSQIQRYDNFIIPVIDSLKYLTPMAYDVLAYCIIEALGHPQKERMKHGDTNISNWLKGLASFCGNIFKKYPIELNGLLQYISNQLKAGKSFDLLVLKEVIQKMSGIDITEEVTSSQLEALAGGELLQAEGAYFNQVRNTKKSSQRLREALVDANLSIPMLLLMAQQRDCIVYKDGSKRHLKLVGMLFDNCLDTLVQFGGFLSTHLSADEYSKRVPMIDDLGLTYHIPADISFFMTQPIIRSSISAKFSQLEKSSKTTGEAEKQDKKAKVLQQEESYSAACTLVMEPIMESSRLLHSPKVWEDISHRLYSTFWSLSLYDLYVPSSRYDDEINHAKQASRDVESNSDMTSSKKRKEQERNNVLIEKLQDEKQRQQDNHRLVTSWLRKEKDSWFYPKVLKNRAITQFLQLCIFPRCRFTATDAIYCAKFVYLLHSLHTPNFSTLLFLDRSFSDISYTVTCCTENEARRYGRFMGALLETVSRWHQTESTYTRECANTPGFISMMRSSGATNERVYLDYENYRHITFKWHFKITKSLVTLLESQDYMQVRNGLIVLTKMLPYYPKVYHLSIVLEKRIEAIMEEEKEKRPDLYALAIGYAGMLKNQRQNLVMENEFHIKEERVKAQQSSVTVKKDPGSSTSVKKEGASATGKKEPPSSSATGKKEPPSSSSTVKKEPAVKKELAVKKEPSSSVPVKKDPSSSVPAKKDPSSSVPAKKEPSSSGSGAVKKDVVIAKKELISSGTTSGRKDGSTAHVETPSRKNGEKATKEKNLGKGKTTVREEVATTQHPCWDVAPSDPSSTPQPVSGTTTPSSTAPAATGGGGGGGGKLGPAHNGPASAASPKTGQRRQMPAESPDPAAEKDAKRRKLEESKSREGKVEGSNNGTSKASTPTSIVKEKSKAERKRERSADKELSDSKRRKESPDSKDVDIKEKKSSKKEAVSLTKKITTPKDELKKHQLAAKVRTVKK